MNGPDRPMRVSLVLHIFEFGGISRVAAWLARGFAAAGLDSELIVFARGGEAEGVLGRDALPVRFLGRSSGSRPLDLLRGLFPLVRHLRRAAPDVVIAAANNVALITVIALRLSGNRRTRVFLKTTNPIASSRHRGLVRWVRLWSYRLIFRWTTAVWTLSAQESAELRAAFPSFRHLFHEVINPYVTPAMLAAPADPAGRREGDGRVVISIARLARQKRLERLIEAFAHIRSADVRLLILGEGEERAGLSALVERLGLQERVSMPGYAADVASALRAADLFVLTSDYEGLPAVVLEAMANNCPVLSTNCFPAARSLLDGAEGCGLIEDHAPAALAALIERHLDMPRPATLRRIAERYAIDNGVRSHIEAMRN